MSDRLNSYSGRDRPSSARAAVALQGVYEISKILSSPARLETTLSNVLRLLSSYLDMHHALIALLDEAGEPSIVVGLGWRETNAREYFVRLPERAIGQIITTKMPLFVQSVAEDPLFAEWRPAGAAGDEARTAFIGVPIKDRERIVGTLTVDRSTETESAPLTYDDLQFLVMVANLVGQTVRLHEIISRDRERLMGETRRLEKELSETGRAGGETKPRVRGIVGESQALRAVLEKIGVVARSNATVLLRGESGTGKELFAGAIHDLSPRQKGPFVKLNCAALPESVLESELFGHEKGAFTGAIAQRKGRFEIADGGTLFLDEIGEISPAFQAKLLRVLQEGEFERVGGSRTIKVNVRLVAATNRNLEEAVASGEFRADLYYRINVVAIVLPALRERPDDIFVLAKEFLKRFSEENHLELSFTPSARSVLERCYFPGNVRELENCVRRTATLSRGPEIVADDFACLHNECLSATLWRGGNLVGAPFNILPKSAAVEPMHAAEPRPSGVPVADDVELPIGFENDAKIPGERERLIEAMERSGWVQAKAARMLNLTPRQIGYALRKYDIPIKKF